MKKELEYICHKNDSIKNMLYDVVCIFRLCDEFSELVICTLSWKPRGIGQPLSVRNEWHLQDGGTQCFSEVMVKLLLAALIFVDNAAYHACMKDCHTARFLQEIATQCFSEVMVKLFVACGLNSDGQCSLPPLDEGVSYSQVSAAGLHTVLLRSDGQAVACGFYSHGKDGIPPLAGGLSYIQVSAGEYHTVLLRSDGQAVACGSNSDGKCSIPPLDEGLAYSQVSAGASHTVLLRSDGQAVACGSNSQGQCSIPPVDEGLSYIQACAGEYHTVLLRSDGEAVACGRNSEGQCSIPPLDEGLSYSQVSGGGFHTVLLRSDGQAVACGKNSDGRCNIPSLMSWRDWLPFGFASPSYRYICDSTSFAMLGKDRVVQVDFFLEGDAGVILTCVGLDGLEVLRLKAQKSNRTVDVCMRVARELNTNVENLRMILPDARLLATICKANPFATLSDVISV